MVHRPKADRLGTPSNEELAAHADAVRRLDPLYARIEFIEDAIAGYPPTMTSTGDTGPNSTRWPDSPGSVLARAHREHETVLGALNARVTDLEASVPPVYKTDGEIGRQMMDNYRVSTANRWWLIIATLWIIAATVSIVVLAARIDA